METDQEKRDRKVRTEFYNNWAAGEHHNHGKQQDIETFEIQDNKNLSSEQVLDVFYDYFKRIP